MKTAVNRVRGIERDIIQIPLASDVAPYYEPQGSEIAIFEAAYRKRLPVMLKGPTGCGKTRFLEHMAYQLKRPLVTVSCHEDLTSSDLVDTALACRRDNGFGPACLTSIDDFVCPERAQYVTLGRRSRRC